MSPAALDGAADVAFGRTPAERPGLVAAAQPGGRQGARQGAVRPSEAVALPGGRLTEPLGNGKAHGASVVLRCREPAALHDGGGVEGEGKSAFFLV